MKICINCKYCDVIKSGRFNIEYNCLYVLKESTYQDMVTGEMVHRRVYLNNELYPSPCSMIRVTACGKEAKYYEEKKQ